MYVIGVTNYNFIKILYTAALFDGQNISYKIRSLEYDAPLKEATIVRSYEEAEKIIEEIQKNIDHIKFANNSIIANIIDKKQLFDKVAYSANLKIYELTSTEVSE